MNQAWIIQTLVDWLRRSLQDSELEVKCDHTTAEKEEPAIYIEQRLPGEGRGNRIKQVDIAVVDRKDRTVKLVLEVDPATEPVKPLGVFFAILLADVYVPSLEHSPSGDYRKTDCVVIYVTVLGERKGSQKIRQFQQIEKAINSKVNLLDYGVRAIRLCHGPDDNAAVAECQKTIKAYLDVKPSP